MNNSIIIEKSSFGGQQSGWNILLLLIVNSNKSVTDIMKMPLFMKNKGILVY